MISGLKCLISPWTGQAATSSEKWCKFDYCGSPEHHITSSHFCKFCDKRHNNINECIYRDHDETKTIAHDEVSGLELCSIDNVYKIIHLEWDHYIRKKSKIIQSLLMDQSMWGQYGTSSCLDHSPLLDKFLSGLEDINLLVKCPICRILKG